MVCLMIVFTSLSQTDTTSKICFPRYVIVGIEKDLIRLDLCDSLNIAKDIELKLVQTKISLKDSIIKSKDVEISLLKDNEISYGGQILLKDRQISGLNKEIKKQKRQKRAAIITGGVVAILILFLLK